MISNEVSVKHKNKLQSYGTRGLIVVLSIILICNVFDVLPASLKAPIGFVMLENGYPMYCSFWDKWSGSKAYFKRVKGSKKIIDSLAILQVEEKRELIDSLCGQWWVPSGNKEVLTVFADLDGNIYGKLSGGEVVLDCGAHIGMYTKHALNQGALKVIAIEPAPENLECLRLNLSEEIDDGRVVVYPKGVWDKEDSLTMYIKDRSASDSFIKGDLNVTDQITLPLTTIDKIVEELDLPRVDVIKMDIEGAERKALMGATQTIKLYNPRLEISVYHLQDNPEVIVNLVTSQAQSYEVDCDCIPMGKSLMPEIAHFISK